MSVLLQIALLGLGLVAMLFGADLLVSKAEKLGKAKRWSPVLVGVAVVGVGTSLPELVVSVLASIQGHPLLAATNVIGSNITNTGLIVGVAALFGGITLHKKTVDYDIPLSIVPIGVLVFGYILRSTLASYLGFILLLTYVGYLLFTSREYEAKVVSATKAPRFTAIDAILMVVAPFLLFGGGEVTLHFAQDLFASFGISDQVIGGVLLALGTSLPELFATVIAVVKKDGQLALGNVLGSNVFNILVVLGTSIIFAPIEASKLFYEIVLLGVVSGVFLLLAKTGKKYSISRIEGMVLLATYIMYLAIMLFVVN